MAHPYVSTELVLLFLRCTTYSYELQRNSLKVYFLLQYFHFLRTQFLKFWHIFEYTNAFMQGQISVN